MIATVHARLGPVRRSHRNVWSRTMGIPVSRAIFKSAKLTQSREAGADTLIVKIIGVCAILTSPFWLGMLFFTSPRDYAYTSSLICVPLLAIACYAAVVHVSQRDRYLKQLLSVGLIARMAVSSIFLWMGFIVYGTSADSFHYWTIGLQIAKDFSIVGWSAFHPPYWSTNLINTMCGLMTLVIGDALPAIFILFALGAMWGSFLFYRAFEIAFPDGDKRLYGLLVVLLPSILFWSSSVGKDALAQIFIGLGCYGFAKFCRQPRLVPAIQCAFGIIGVGLIRPHVAAMFAMGVTFGYSFGRKHAGKTSRLTRIFVIPLILAGTYFVVREAGRFVGVEDSNTQSSIKKANVLTKNTDIGGSAYNGSEPLPIRIAESPFLLFRPFPWEIHNTMAAASSIESTALLLLCWSRRRIVWSTVRQRPNAFVIFALAFCVLFSVAFAAATSNFGILVRERIMMLPVALMLICARGKQVPVKRYALRRNSLLLVPVPISEEN